MRVAKSDAGFGQRIEIGRVCGYLAGIYTNVALAQVVRHNHNHIRRRDLYGNRCRNLLALDNLVTKVIIASETPVGFIAKCTVSFECYSAIAWSGRESGRGVLADCRVVGENPRGGPAQDHSCGHAVDVRRARRRCSLLIRPAARGYCSGANENGQQRQAKAAAWLVSGYDNHLIRFGHSCWATVIMMRAAAFVKALQARNRRELKMLVIFKSKAYSDITMFGDVALKLIRIMGHGGTVPGAIGADEIRLALDKLRAAVQADNELNAGKAEEPNDAQEGNARVSLAQRALPLIEMLEAAERLGTPVMWSN